MGRKRSNLIAGILFLLTGVITAIGGLVGNLDLFGILALAVVWFALGAVFIAEAVGSRKEGK
jgi:hypothetical protein